MRPDRHLAQGNVDAQNGDHVVVVPDPRHLLAQIRVVRLVHIHQVRPRAVLVLVILHQIYNVTEHR